jgi:hypothetical protein
MRSSRLTFWAILLTVMFSTSAFAWGPATHTYIVDQLNGRGEKADQLYGAVMPDINLLLSADGQSPYFQSTHYDFTNVWTVAANSHSEAYKGLAFGFASHNEKWGADYSAHIHSLRYPEFQQGGYVIKKSQELCKVLNDAYGSQVPPGILTLDNCHFILEYGLDLMVKSKDPWIGAKVMLAARFRSPRVSGLLMAAYPDVDPMPKLGLPAGTTYGTEFAMAEQVWREKMIQYGQILMLPNDKAVPALAAFLNQMAHDLEVLPGELDATQLIGAALVASMQVCATDFSPELKATVANVNFNMHTHGIR